MRRTPPAKASLVDRTIYATDEVAVGVWRCPLGYPGFVDTGPIEGQIVVFPRTSVWIEPSGGSRFVADARVATVFNRGQTYRRFPIHPAGDFGEWWRVSPTLAREIAATIDPRAAERPEQPFGVPWVPTESRLYLRQRLLYRRLRAGCVEPFAAEEAILNLVADTLTASANRTERATSARDREIAAAARERIARNPTSREPLAEMASTFGVPIYRLCRAYRNATGSTLHAHRLDLRLRLALERLDEPDLARVALDLGFAHHSHFTEAFRRRYGQPPSRFRAA